MKYDVTAQVIGFTGEPLKETNKEDSPAITLRALLQIALVNADQSEYKTGEQKFKLYQLLNKIYTHDILEVSAEEVATLKNVVGRVFGVTTVGAVYTVLENPLPAE